MKRGTLILSLLLILFLSGCISLGPRVKGCNVDKAVEFLIENPDEDIDSIKKTLSSKEYNCKALAENSVELLPKEIRKRAKEMREIDIEHATECAVVGNFEDLHCHDDDRCGECLDDPATDEVEGFNLVDPGEDIIDVRDVVLVANTIDDPCYLDSGDLNGDDLINVLDVVIIIPFVMGEGTDFTFAQECAADVNQDEIYNVLDVVSMINIILYGGGRDREDAILSADWITTSSEICGEECTQHQDCSEGYFCHSGWDGEKYGPKFCALYDNAYCENNPCGVGDGDCDYNDNWGDGTLGSEGCGPDMTCGNNHNLDNCGADFPEYENGPDCCVGDEPIYGECDNFYDTCGEIPVQINLDQSGNQNIQGVQIDICPDPFYPTEDHYEILSEELTAFNSWMWRVEFDGEPTDAASPCSCASLTGECTRFIGIAITLDQDKLIQSGTTNLPIVQVNIQNPNFPINTESNYQDVGISGILTTNVGQQITTTFNGLSETLCGNLGFTCEEGVSIWDIPADFINLFGVTECSTYNQGDIIDCSGSVNGVAYEDNCGTCDPDPSNDCVQDCAGVWGGDDMLDICGTCDSDPSNDCVQDCAGVWGGESYEDDCGVCDPVSENDNLDIDCAGVCFGSLLEDMCGTCDADSSNDCVQDACGVWGGNTIAECGSCEYVYLWGECYSIDWTTDLVIIYDGCPEDCLVTGRLPPEIGLLTNLNYVRLSNNQLTGIPPEIGQLTKLTYLSFQSNLLTGEIPSEIGQLTKLTHLNLGQNLLTGEIPSEIGQLTNLTWFSTKDNQLTGEIPPEIGQLTKLELFSLSQNQLTGEILPWIGQLTKLTFLSLHTNQFTGEIPPEIGQLTNLQYLYLSNNQLTGEIPPEIGNLGKEDDDDTYHLRYLHLNDNQLTGQIPPEICNISPYNGWESFSSGFRIQDNKLCPPYPVCNGVPVTLVEEQDTSQCGK